MQTALTAEQLATLRDYAEGHRGTRSTIELLGMHDYGHLIVALAQNDFDFPKPADTATHRAHVARATAILQPLLRRGA